MRRRTSSSSRSHHDSPPPIDLRRPPEEEAAAAARPELGPHKHKRRRPPLPCPTMGRCLTQRASFSSASSSTAPREETRPCHPPFLVLSGLYLQMVLSHFLLLSLKR
jgi:hypothetical protein